MAARSKKVDAPVEDVLTDTPKAPRGKTSKKRAPADGQQQEAPDEITGSTSESITREAIERRAYERYEQRGRQPGHHEDDWLEAERELREGGGRGE